MRPLSSVEIDHIAGGSRIPQPQDIVTFEDANRNGEYDQGEKILYYTTADGVRMSEDLYNSWTNVSSFSTLGQLVDTLMDRPWESIGTMFDNMSLFNRSVDLTGSEFIDWKTGGWHRQGMGNPGEHEPSLPPPHAE